MKFDKEDWARINDYVIQYVNGFFKRNYNSSDWGFADKQDIKQEILCYVYRHSNKINGDKFPWGLLKTICHNITINKIRDYNKKVRKESKPFGRYANNINDGLVLQSLPEPNYKIAQQFISQMTEAQQKNVFDPTTRGVDVRRYDRERKRAHNLKQKYKLFLANHPDLHIFPPAPRNPFIVTL